MRRSYEVKLVSGLLCNGRSLYLLGKDKHSIQDALHRLLVFDQERQSMRLIKEDDWNKLFRRDLFFLFGLKSVSCTCARCWSWRFLRRNDGFCARIALDFDCPCGLERFTAGRIVWLARPCRFVLTVFGFQGGLKAPVFEKGALTTYQV